MNAYLNRVRPMFNRLFNLAHAICGNADRAEFAVRSAMLECWVSGEAEAGSHGLRESLQRSTIASALRMAEEHPDADWDELRDEGDVLSAFIAQENALLRRAVALRHGCGFTSRRIGRLLGVNTRRIQTMMDAVETRAERRLHLRGIEQAFERTVRTQLSRPSAAAPEISGVFRTFRADAADLRVSRHLPARILSIALTALLALLCMASIFLATVLLQPEGTIRADIDHSAIEQIDP